jgi:hypothetical protein
MSTIIEDTISGYIPLFYNKLAWNTISGYNVFLPTYFNGDLDIDAHNSMTGTADIVLRSGNIYMSISSYINSMPIINLTYLDVNSSIAAQLLSLQLSISGLTSSTSLIDVDNTWTGNNTFNHKS